MKIRDYTPQVGDIVMSLEVGKLEGEVVACSSKFSRVIWQGATLGEEVFTDSLVVICRPRDTEHIQMVSVLDFAAGLGYMFNPEKFIFTHHKNIPNKFVGFNTMVQHHNQVEHSNKLVEKVKLNWAKRKKKLNVLSHWIKYL